MPQLVAGATKPRQPEPWNHLHTYRPHMDSREKRGERERESERDKDCIPVAVAIAFMLSNRDQKLSFSA